MTKPDGDARRKEAQRIAIEKVETQKAKEQYKAKQKAKYDVIEEARKREAEWWPERAKKASKPTGVWKNLDKLEED